MATSTNRPSFNSLHPRRLTFSRCRVPCHTYRPIGHRPTQQICTAHGNNDKVNRRNESTLNVPFDTPHRLVVQRCLRTHDGHESMRPA